MPSEILKAEAVSMFQVHYLNPISPKGTALWKEETVGIDEFYAKLGRVPAELQGELATLKSNLNK